MVHRSEDRMQTKPYEVRYDRRLKIDRPFLHIDYEELSEAEREEFELICQEICSKIPDQIKAWEQEYNNKYESLKEADDEEVFYQLTDELNEISSRICDLNLLFLYIEGTYISQSIHA